MRFPRYQYTPAHKPQRYPPPPGYYHYNDYYYDPPRRDPYYYDYYDYGYDPRPEQKPGSNNRPPPPNSVSMDDMMEEAKKYSGKTRSIADMIDDVQGTYEDKILPTFGGNISEWSNF